MARRFYPRDGWPALPPAGQPSLSLSSHSHTSTSQGGYDVSRLFHCKAQIAREGGECYHGVVGESAVARSLISGFGLCATEAFKPRQVRKEATVEGPSVCH